MREASWGIHRRLLHVVRLGLGYITTKREDYINPHAASKRLM
jgi:hypothetical protein